MLRQGSEVHLTSRSADTIHGANPTGSRITREGEGEKLKNKMGKGRSEMWRGKVRSKKEGRLNIFKACVPFNFDAPEVISEYQMRG